MNKTKKIYVASSWRNSFQPAVVNKLREHGYDVYDFRNPPKKKGFSWSDIDPDWLNWSTEKYCKALQHPIAKEGFASDFNAMKEFDVCVLVLPCGRSANAEAGWMKGVGKKVYVLQLQHEEPELMYMMFDGVLGSVEQLFTVLKPAIKKGGVEKEGKKRTFTKTRGEKVRENIKRLLPLKGKTLKL